MVHGYTTAFWWSSGIFAVGLIVAVTVFPARVRPVATADDDAVPAEPVGDVSLATD